MTIKVPCGTIVVPYSGQKAGKVYWDQHSQHPDNMPYFVLMWRMKYRTLDPLIVIHIKDEKGVIVEKYINSECVAAYKAPRTEMHQLHSKQKQYFLSKKLDAIGIAQRSYLLSLKRVLRRVANEKYLAERKNTNNHERARREKLERHEKLRRSDFSPFTFEPLPYQLSLPIELPKNHSGEHKPFRYVPLPENHLIQLKFLYEK